MYIQFLSEKKKKKETTGGKICRERERKSVGVICTKIKN